MNKTKKEELKALKTGDIILLSDGKKAELLKVKVKKFDCLIEDEVWTYPIEMFDKLIKKAKPNPLLEEVQEIVKRYKGQSMGTVYGPSTIVGFTKDFKHVELKEFGMETYHLTLKDFLDEYNQNGIIS